MLRGEPRVEPGWWGDDPSFHTPTYVLTHRPLPSLEMDKGTTFHFLDASPAEALEVARAAAEGQDVRIGGGHVRPLTRRAASAWPGPAQPPVDPTKA